MKRRAFLRTGVALSAAGLSPGLASPLLGADGRRQASAGDADAGPPGPDGDLRLNSNENPLGLSPDARRAVIDGMGEANRYPRADRVRLTESLAHLHGVEAENVVLGNGSTEVLQMAVQALAAPGATLVLAEPTFEDVPWYAQPFDYTLEFVPLNGDFAHDLGRMRERADAAAGRTIVYICNPNNPTGTLTASAKVDDWIESADEDTYFLVDEAYFEYCVDPAYWSCAKWISSHPNVIVTRSFSKIYGMAGMRLGYGLAHPEMAAELRRYIGKNNANQLALVAGLAGLGDAELIPSSREANRKAMKILHDCLDELGLEYLPSHTNFVMHRINGDLETYRERMQERGVRVGRPFPPMLDYNRISLGLPEEMERFAEILRDFRRQGWV